VLSREGRADLAYAIVTQPDFPGWGWMLKNGATTLWEHWEFSDNTFSHNHPMFGSVSEWFYKALAGIQLAPDCAGCDKLILAPQPVGDLTWVKASHDTVRGKIISEWRKENGRFQWRVRVPAGASATAFVPAASAAQLTESGKPLEQAAGVRFLRMENGKAVLALGSGDYLFVSGLK
jgi:alpha-L-rhamnosidase